MTTATQLTLQLTPPPGASRYWVYVYPAGEDPAWAQLLDKRIVRTLETAEGFEELVDRVINGKPVGLVEIAAEVPYALAPVLFHSWTAGTPQ